MEEAEVRARLKEYFSAAGLPHEPSDENERLVAVYLFGSFGWGEPRPASDVDLGLLYDRPPPAALASSRSRVEDRLELMLGRTVQAVVLNIAPVDLVHRVLRDGELLYESDRSKRIQFEVAARREYFDLLPVLR